MRNIILALRFSMSFIMLWAFFDKTLGLGFNTQAGMGWIDGVSPTDGFLRMAVKGPFTPVFNAMAGSGLVEWLFMMGLLGVGLSFLIGHSMKFAGYCGAAMMVLMYLSLLLPVFNPVVDEHIIYALVFVLVGVSKEARSWMSLQKA